MAYTRPRTLRPPLLDSSGCHGRFEIKSTNTLDFAGQRAPKIRTMVAKNPTIGPEGTSEGIVYGYRGKSRTPLISSAGFLGTNHQIADEMSEIIMLRNKTTVEGVQYKLHLTACHKSLLPTWLSLPAPLKYVRTLDVDLQLSTYENFEWVGSVGCLAELSIKVLLRFFRCGPELVEGLEQLPLQEQLRRRMPYLEFAMINLVAVPLQGVDMRDLALESLIA